MKTVTIQIGNSDDKLTQKEWWRFVNAIKQSLDLNMWRDIHFSGGAENWAPWQNFCIVVVIDESEVDNLCEVVSYVGKEYKQDSVAVTVGETRFV